MLKDMDVYVDMDVMWMWICLWMLKDGDVDV